MLLSLIIDKNGYIQQFCTGGFIDGESVHFETDYIPDDFYECYRAYHLDKDNSLVLDTNKLSDVSAENDLNNLKALRETECFAVVNRGKLWYDRLTAEQLKELDAWYQEWLDITEQKSYAKSGPKIPERPRWLV